MDSVRKRPLETLLALVLLVGIGWFYAWTVAPEGMPEWAGKTGSGYYNLLVQGFMKGHLYLNVPDDPFLAALKDPWSAAERAGHGMHDASYYRGHFYIYFGVTPAVILFLPFRLLTGNFLDERAASLLFAWIGFVASVALLKSLRDRYYARASTWTILGGVLMLGLADLVPLLLRRASIWEVPITCAYALYMVALWSLDRALHAARPVRWLVLASLAIGGAIGARPDYLLGVGALAIVTAWLAFCAARGQRLWLAWRDPSSRRVWLFALTPIAAVGIGLIVYNLVRFGNVFEFGQRYQFVDGSPGELPEGGHQIFEFTWRFFVYGLRLYWLAPANWSHFFPYVLPVNIPKPPVGVKGIEDPYGILPNLPIIGWGLVLMAAGALRISRTPRRLIVVLLAIAVGAIGVTVPLMAFNGYANRYMVDFLPALVVLAATGLLEFSARPLGLHWLGLAGAATTFVFLIFSIGFGVLASVRHNELLRAEHPAVYTRLVHAGNWVSDRLDRWHRIEYGPIEMKVIFPEGADGTNEPLVVTGWNFLSDYLFVHYLSKDSIQFGLEHTSRTLLLGEPVHIQPGVIHTLRVDLGSLYPPAGAPYFDRFNPEQVRLRPTTVSVAIDGVTAFHRRAEFYDAISPEPSIGSVDGRPGFTRPFSGRIVSWRRLKDADVAPLAVTGGQSGALRLEVVFPPVTGVQSEPLLCTGETGRGDLVYLRYLGPRQVAFGYDHWSRGGPVSQPVEIDPTAVQVIEIDTAAIDPANPGRLRVWLNGRAVFDQPEPCYPAPPETIAVGTNPIHSSAAAEMFSGRIVHSRRLGH